MTDPADGLTEALKQAVRDFHASHFDAEHSADIIAEYKSGGRDHQLHDDFALAAALSLSPPEAGEDAWLPIETAPKDGSEILAYARDDRNYYGVAEWATKKDFPANSVAGWFWPFAIRPTHWQPLPASPAPQEPQP